VQNEPFLRNLKFYRRPALPSANVQPTCCRRTTQHLSWLPT